MFAWFKCFLDGHYWWVAGTDESVFPKRTVYCLYCHKRPKEQPYLRAATKDTRHEG